MVQKLNGITMPTRQGEIAFPFTQKGRVLKVTKKDLFKKTENKKLDYYA